MSSPRRSSVHSASPVFDDRWGVPAFVGFTLVYAYVAGVLALRKPFWHDEIYTLLFADLPSLPAMWRAAHDGIDLAPPLNAMLTHLLQAVATAGPLTTRLPALIGYWTMTLVVFDLVRRRSHAIAALSAVILLSLTEAFRYAIEARGYGLMLGLTAVVLWAWSEAARGRSRTRNLALLTVALAAGLWNQYFAVLVLLPIVAGEAARLIRERKADWGIAGAVALALMAVLPLRGAMRMASGHAATYWRHAEVSDIASTYVFLFQPLLSTSFAIAGLVIVLLVVAGRTRRYARPEPTHSDLPAHEVVAGMAMLAVPAAAVVLGMYGAGVFVPRYALAGVMGISLVVPIAVARAGSRHGAADLILATSLVATFGASAYRAVAAGPAVVHSPVDARPQLLGLLRSDQIVAVSGPTEYLQLWYYAPPELRSRLVYLADPAAALQAIGSDTVDRNYLALRRWSPVTVSDFEPFLGGHPSFQVYALGRGWLVERLRALGARLDERGREGDAVIYEVRAPEPAGRDS